MDFRTFASGVPRRVRRAAGCLLLAGHAGLAHAAPPPSGDDLVGLWGSEPLLGPQVRGAVLVERRAGLWTVRIGGFEASAGQVGDHASIALPGGQGTLRLWDLAGGPEAFWIQPEGPGASFAVPVRLRGAGPGAWRGIVAPIDATFPVYLTITRAADDSLHGAFRNPTQNWPGRPVDYLVGREDEAVTFTNAVTGKLRWRQPYDPQQRTITFDFGGPIALSPRSAEQAVGLVPRSPTLPPWRYRRPVDLHDGWIAGDVAAVAMDRDAIETIVRDLGRADPSRTTSPHVHSLLVARRGRLVLEEYFRGYAHDLVHDLRSASKTVTSIMLGAAIRHGARIGSDTTLPGTRITVGHLLSHSSGIACDDDDDASPGNEDAMQSQGTQPDWYAFFEALPAIHEPGSTYAYCSAGVNMVGKLLGSATGQWLPRWFDRELARPLQFSSYGVNLMPSGEAYTGGGMHLLPRDFLKFGQLVLDAGRWHGRRLVSAAWIRESVAHRIDRPDGSDDGLGWHRHRITVGARSFQSYEASGNGGQFLVVVPDLRLAIVVTAGDYGAYPVWKRIREELVPAVVAATR